MTDTQLAKTIELFEDQGFDHWLSFVEIANHKEAIKAIWFSKLNDKLIRHFTNNMPDTWSWEERKICWHLKEYNSSSLSVWLENFSKFSLYSYDLEYDKAKIKELLDSKQFAPLTNSFERIDKRFDGGYKIVEYANFSFDTPLDGRYSNDSLAYHANVNTDSYAQQIIEKVERIINDDLLTELIREINAEAKID